MGHVSILLDEMGLDKMGLDEMGINLRKDSKMFSNNQMKQHSDSSYL